jgi:hypothetical protein
MGFLLRSRVESDEILEDFSIRTRIRKLKQIKCAHIFLKKAKHITNFWKQYVFLAINTENSNFVGIHKLVRNHIRNHIKRKRIVELFKN